MFKSGDIAAARRKALGFLDGNVENWHKAQQQHCGANYSLISHFCVTPLQVKMYVPKRLKSS